MYQQERTEAVKLRFQGNGYGVIAKNIGVSKTSVSNWCKKLELPTSAKKILEKKNRHIREKFKLYNQQKHQFVQNENKEIIERSIKQIPRLSKRDLLLIGASLYWAEGYNRQDKRPSPYISFGNSNPDMVVLFLRFLQEVMQISEEKLRPVVQIHKNLKPESAINFWARVTNIPQKSFRITHQTSRASKGKRPYNSLPYGTLKLNVVGRQNFFMIKGWIEGLIKQNGR